ncbi:MAG: hypothetical protein LQ344_003205 [Seirophora lacunosa]|nr:MAG: hypothetical protein LQ344_003205 [Seirophora lacunosa]
MATPRVFIVRHGETEWSLNGRHTGTTELPLTADGEKRIRATGQALVGDDRLIVPSQLAHIYVSPRKRAQRTLELLNLGCRDKLPWQEQQQPGKEHHVRTEAKVQVTDDIREWDYGDYEGLRSATIIEQRNQSGQGPWDIWRDGCPGGEYVGLYHTKAKSQSSHNITERLDRLIDDIRTRFHEKAIGQPSPPSDVLLVAHGHILRAFAMRWIKRELTEGVSLFIDEPAIL